MTITLVADLSQAGANAYCDVAYADTYMTTRGFSEDWTAIADPEVKKQTLIWATNLFETFKWLGTRDKTLDPGPLRWPRRNLKDRDGNVSDAAILPEEIKKGLCEMALFMVKEDRLAGFDVIQADTSQIGPIGERKLRYNKYPPGVVDYISWYLNGGLSGFQIRVTTGL